MATGYGSRPGAGRPLFSRFYGALGRAPVSKPRLHFVSRRWKGSAAPPPRATAYVPASSRPGGNQRKLASADKQAQDDVERVLRSDLSPGHKRAQLANIQAYLDAIDFRRREDEAMSVCASLTARLHALDKHNRRMPKSSILPLAQKAEDSMAAAQASCRRCLRLFRTLPRPGWGLYNHIRTCIVFGVAYLRLSWAARRVRSILRRLRQGFEDS